MMTVGQCLIYESIHFYYSAKRKRIVTELAVLAVVVGGVIGLGILIKCSSSSDSECAEFTTYWFGLIMAIVSCFRYGAQASTFGAVVKTRNASSISPSMTAGALFGSLAWVVYSVLAGDPYYLASGLAGTVSCLIQIVLLVKYPRFHVVDDASSDDKADANRITVAPTSIGSSPRRQETELETLPE